MEKENEIANYVVKYNSDPMLFTDNHVSEIINLTDIDEKCFYDQGEAVLFLSECILPITKIEELVPELKKMKKFNYILPERNIKPKHILSSKLDTICTTGEWDIEE
jgi:hypothetical protein